jgi:hypothetical protein
MKTNTVSVEDSGKAVQSILRLEGALALVAAVWAYRFFGGAWGLFALLFLAPDLGMLGYLVNSRVGAWVYNVVHSYLAPVVLAAIWWMLTLQRPSALWLIWVAHIGFDRMLGYGLKYFQGFKVTHLSRAGLLTARAV